MSLHSHSSGSTGVLTPSQNANISPDITKLGYLRKLKTMKKKYFAVRSGSRFHPPRLEYYDNEKKFRAGLPPKRTIDLSKCFSVNKRSDSKHKYGIVIYTKDDSFSILTSSAEEHDDWFNEILEAFKEGICDTDQAQHHYECVWPVTLQKSGLGASRSLSGHYRLCLSYESVSLVKLNSILPEVVFQLRLIRRCGHRDGSFFMEVGRSSVTGEGELWMAVEDTALARDMHDIVLNAMRNPTSSRVRTDSSGHSSHPISVPQQPPHEPPRVRTTSMGSPCRPHVPMEKARPKSLFAQPTSAPLCRSPGTPGSAPFGTSPHSTVDYMDGDRLRSNSMESHGSRSGAESAHSCDISDVSPMDNHTSSKTQESEYIPMAPCHSSVESSRERLNSVDSVADTTPVPETYIDMAPTSMTSPVAHNTNLSHTSLPQQTDTYIDMSPLANDTQVGENGSYAFMGGFPRGTKSAPSSVKSGPPTHKSGPGSHKSAPGSYKGGPGSYKSGPGSHKSGPSSVKSLSSVEGRDDGYIDMEPGSETLSPVIDLKSPGYLSMSIGQTTKLSNMGEMRPDKVYSYLSDDSFSGETPHIRTYSVGSKTSMTKPTLTYQAYQESVAKQGQLCNNKSSSAPHLIPPKGRAPTETPSPVQTYVTSPCTRMSKSYKSDDSDSFMELDFCRPRTASDSYSYRRRAGSFGQTQTQHNHSFQHFRERASSHGHTSKPVLLKRISSESVRTTSQELLKKTSMDSLNRSSRESLKSSQESLRKAVLDSRQRGSFQMDYMEMSPDKHKDASRKKHVYISNKKQSKKDEGKEYFDMTVGSPTQSFIHGMDFNGHSVTPTSPVTVKLTAPDPYMEMAPGQVNEVKIKNEPNHENVNKLSIGSQYSGPQKKEVNPYMNISYERHSHENGTHSQHANGGGGGVHARQASSPTLLESQHTSNEGSLKGLSPESALHSHQPASRPIPSSKSPIPRSPLVGEEEDGYLSFSPGDLTDMKKSDEKRQSNNSSYYSQKRNSKLSPKSPEVLREESDSSYMSFSSDGSLSDSKNSDVWLPRNSHRMKHSHRKSETVHEESDAGYISFSPVNVHGDSEGLNTKEPKSQPSSHRRYHPKFDYRKDAQKTKKTNPAGSKLNQNADSYMSFAPSIVIEGESVKEPQESKSEKLSFEAGVVSSNINNGCNVESSLKEEESAYLEFSPAGASSDKESSKKNLPSQFSGLETGKMNAKKKHSADHQQRRTRKVSSGSKPKLSPSETPPQESGPLLASLSSDYSSMSFPSGDSHTSRPLFDPSKAPKSARSPGQPERGVLRSPRLTTQKNGKETLDNKSPCGKVAGTAAAVSIVKNTDRSRKISCESLKGSMLDTNTLSLAQSSGILPKRGSTPNIPSYLDKGGPCSGVVGSMLPGDRHSYSEPSTSDLAVSGILTPNSGANSRHSSRTSLNSITSKETLNYASLDLGSSDNVTGAGDGGITFLSAPPSQGVVGRTRHGSNHQEPEDAPPFYAQIDFKKCEELKNSKR